MGEINVKASVDVDVVTGDWTSARWFGWKFGRCVLKVGKGPDAPYHRRLLGTIAQAFARDIEDKGLVCGIGLGQLGHRHMLYVGLDNGVPRACVAFAWLTRPA